MRLCLLTMFLAAAALAGCVTVDTTRKPVSAPPPAVEDGRSAAELRAENAELRNQTKQLQYRHDELAKSLQNRQDDLRDLKRRREAIKDRLEKLDD